MDTFFIISAIVLIVAAAILFAVNRIKKSILISNISFVLVLIAAVSAGCYVLEVDSLFQEEYSTEYRQVTTSAVTEVKNNGRPVKKQSETTTPKITQQQAESAYSGIVYITKSGKKYHFSYTCGGNEYYECTLEQALKRGLEPCKRCTR